MSAMTDALVFFTADGDTLHPTPVARSLWAEDQMHGVAASGAMARALEAEAQRLGRSDVRPARYSVDLFRPPKMVPTTVAVRLLREGRRIVVIDAELVQDGRSVARASATFLAPSETPAGKVWVTTEHPEPPSLEQAPVGSEPHVPFFRSGADWSQRFTDHQDPAPKRAWQTAVPVVAGEPATPFQAAASVADATSMVTHWGTHGVEFINTDITLSLSRLPRGVQLGLATIQRVEEDGIAVGTAAVFDRDGVFGTASVSALANARRTVDFEEHDFAARA